MTHYNCASTRLVYLLFIKPVNKLKYYNVYYYNLNINNYCIHSDGDAILGMQLSRNPRHVDIETVTQSKTCRETVT